jgi:hypothetical protein
MRTIVALLLFSSCGATLTQLKTRAALDLDCDSSRLQVDSLDVGTSVVTGCGKRAIYVEQFNNNRYPAWLLNSDIRPVSGGAPVGASP